MLRRVVARAGLARAGHQKWLSAAVPARLAPRASLSHFSRRQLSNAADVKPPPLPLSPFGAAPPKLASNKKNKSWTRFRTPVIVAAMITGIAGYFYKGSVEKAALKELHDRLQRRPISPQEIEDLRVGNKVTCDQLLTAFKKLEEQSKTTRDGDSRVPVKTLGSVLEAVAKPEDAPADWKLSHRHDFDRLCQWLVETDAGTANDGTVDIGVAKVALSLFTKEKANDRLRFLLRAFSSSSKRRGFEGTTDVVKSDDDSRPEQPAESITRDELRQLIAALVHTFQLDFRSQTVEHKPGRFALWTPATYEIGTPSQLLDEAVRALAKTEVDEKARRAKKGLSTPEENAISKESFREQVLSKQEFSFNEARQMLFGRQVCVWGQCHNNVSRSRRRNKPAEGVNEFDSAAATRFDADGVPNWEKTPLAEGASSFIPAEKFEGSKPGYYFSAGPQGVGYVSVSWLCL